MREVMFDMFDDTLRSSIADYIGIASGIVSVITFFIALNVKKAVTQKLDEKSLRRKGKTYINKLSGKKDFIIKNHGYTEETMGEIQMILAEIMSHQYIRKRLVKEIKRLKGLIDQTCILEIRDGADFSKNAACVQLASVISLIEREID